MTSEDSIKVLQVLDGKIAAEVFSECHSSLQSEIIQHMKIVDIANIIKYMESDNATDILSNVDEGIKNEILSHISDSELVENIRELSNFPHDTAGALMNKEYIEVRQNWTAEKCLKKIKKEYKDIDDIYAVYITDKSGKFL